MEARVTAESRTLRYRPQVMLPLLVLLLQVTPPATTQVVPVVTAPPTASAERVDRFLTELEASGATIKSYSGALALEKYDALVEESERRFGRVVLEKVVLEKKDSAQRFAIYFDEFVDGSGRSDRSVDHWIYKDGWLCEQDHRNKSFTKRQIVAPGESFDPLALGQGPIPIPIGQKKSEVLARFEVSEGELPADIPLLGSLQNVAALKLIPRAGTSMAKETASVELFYDRLTLAPTGVVIREKNGNRTVARITRPVINGEVRDEDRALLEIPAPDPKEWTIDVRPWQGAERVKPTEPKLDPKSDAPKPDAAPAAKP